MIRLHHFLITFMLLLTTVLFMSYITRNKTAVATDQNISYKENVESALECAIATINYDGNNVFDTDAKRREALEAFYRSYAMTTNQSRSKVEDKMPFVILLDNNGFYVCYDEEGSYYTSTISPLHKWANTIGNFNVSYELNGNIEAAYLYPDLYGGGQGSVFKGSLKDVIKEVETNISPAEAANLRNGLTGVHNGFNGGNNAYIEGTNDFEKIDVIRQDIVNQEITDAVNYYVNNFNDRYNDYETEYMININGVTQDAQRKILRPTVMAFTQGPQKDEINIFAFVGTEVAPKTLYYMKEESGILMYHSKDCYSNDTGFSMEQCAIKGAYPHNCVR